MDFFGSLGGVQADQVAEDGDEGVDPYAAGYEDEAVYLGCGDREDRGWVGEGAAYADREWGLQEAGRGEVEVLGWGVLGFLDGEFDVGGWFVLALGFAGHGA